MLINFLIGVLSSLAASVIIYFYNYQLGSSDKEVNKNKFDANRKSLRVDNLRRLRSLAYVLVVFIAGFMGWAVSYSFHTPNPINSSPAKPELIFIEGGHFTLGDTLIAPSDREVSRLDITLSNFSLGKYEVTIEEYDLFCLSTERSLVSDNGWGRMLRPVTNVQFIDILYYCNWLSGEHNLEDFYRIELEISGNFFFGQDTAYLVQVNRDANGYRLPTMSEWEFAARINGQTGIFQNGTNMVNTSIANFNPDIIGEYRFSYYSREDTSFLNSLIRNGIYREKTIPIGSIESNNSLDLYDLCGNVSEWCWSSFKTNGEGYIGIPKRGLPDPMLLSLRITKSSKGHVKGCSWKDRINDCQSASFSSAMHSERSNTLGFRLARSIPHDKLSGRRY